MNRLLALGLVLLASLGSACTSTRDAAPTPAASPSASARSEPSTPEAPVAQACLATLPVSAEVVPREVADTIAAGSSHPEIARASLAMSGNAAVWTNVPRDGISGRDLRLIAVRLLPGTLTGSATRLDAAAPSIPVVAMHGYGLDGLQVASVSFPSPGCWEVTLRVEDAESQTTPGPDEALAFTVLVVG